MVRMFGSKTYVQQSLNWSRKISTVSSPSPRSPKDVSYRKSSVEERFITNFRFRPGSDQFEVPHDAVTELMRGHPSEGTKGDPYRKRFNQQWEL